MPIVSRIVAVLAALAAIVLAGPTVSPSRARSPGEADGPLRREHFAFVNQLSYLDGPRQEAMAGRDPRPAFDKQGNAFFLSAFWSSGSIRCVRADGAFFETRLVKERR